MKNLIRVSFFIVVITFFCVYAHSAPIFTDADCVACHVFGTAINISVTHPNLLVGCTTCHGPENLGLHRNGIRELDVLFYNYTGTVANVGCGVCHGEPPFAVCLDGIVPDHCLDPAGCVPGVYNCMNCHPNFNGLPTHIYPLTIPFATLADISRCLLCHGLALTSLLSGAHNRHLTSELMAPATTGSTLFSIDCLTCHPTLTANLGPDHIVCIPGTSNANLPGIVPVVFNPLLPLIGGIDSYQLGPVGGTGTCIVYCHSNGATPPALASTLGYPGSAGLPIGWQDIFPIDPLILNCFCCHDYPPGTHAPGQTNCNNCHPTPVLSINPVNTYHINGNVDLWRLLLTNSSPQIAFIADPVAQNEFINPFLPIAGNGINMAGESPSFTLFPFIGTQDGNTSDIQLILSSANALLSLFNGIAAPLQFPFSLYVPMMPPPPGLFIPLY
ncbi:MAG: hypothetical protein ACMUJM_04510 [bacterium]